MAAREIAPGDMRLAGWPAAGYRLPDNLASMTSSALSTSALATFLPFLIPTPITLARIGFYLVTAQAGAECRLGLYSDSNGAPGALILDAGTLDLSSGGGAVKEVTIAQELPPGLIWTCCQMKNVATQVTAIRVGGAFGPLVPVVAAQLSSVAMPRYYSQAITYGPALPADAGAVTTSGGADAPVVVLRSA
jgi:hypothetical protein